MNNQFMVPGTLFPLSAEYDDITRLLFCTMYKEVYGINSGINGIWFK